MGMRPIVQIERNDSDERFRDKVNSNFMTLAQEDRIGTDTKRASLVSFVNTYAEETAADAVSDFVEMVLPGELSPLQEQIDGKVETFFTTDHTLDPSADWTLEQKAAHTGDLWYNDEDGYRLLKRWNGSAWVVVRDQDAIDAATDASRAQDTADGKRTVFTAQPVAPYFIGDLWLTSLVDGAGDIKKCISPNIVIGTFSDADWVIASRYTDDSTHPDLLDEARIYAERYTDITSGEAKATPYYTPVDSVVITIAVRLTLARKIADARALHERISAHAFYDDPALATEKAEYVAALIEFEDQPVMGAPLDEVTTITEPELVTLNAAMSTYYVKMNALLDKLALFFSNTGGTVLIDGVGLKIGTFDPGTGLYGGPNTRLTTTELQFRYDEEVKVDVGSDETHIVNATLAGDTLVTEKIRLPDQIDISTVLSIQKIAAGININFL